MRHVYSGSEVRLLMIQAASGWWRPNERERELISDYLWD